MPKLVGFGAAKPLAEAMRHAAAIAKLENFMVLLLGIHKVRPLKFVIVVKRRRRSMEQENFGFCRSRLREKLRTPSIDWRGQK